MSLVTELSADFVTPSSSSPVWVNGLQGPYVRSNRTDLPGTSLRVVKVNGTVPRVGNSVDYIGLPEAGIIFQTPTKYTPVAPVEDPPYDLFPVSAISGTGALTQYYLPLYYNLDD
jgi:hypothetical protein